MANRFDELVNFMFAKRENVDEIMSFFYNYWGKGHILSNDKAFFEYEFGNGNDDINFLLARDKNDNSIMAVYGFYLYNVCNGSAPIDIAGGPSKVRPDCSIPFLGMEMYKRLPQMLKARSVIGVGLNKKTSFQISTRLLKRYGGTMQQFYRLNKDADYAIARINEKIILPIDEEKQYNLKEMHSIDDLQSCLDVDSFIERVPFKDKSYIDKRYFKHPIYKYKIYVMESHLAIVAREICINATKILRIVDVLGDLNYLKNTGMFLDELLQKNNYEYVDIVESGLDDDILKRMGFVRNVGDINIIPNYFEPFVQSNVEILFDSTKKSAVIFKADADQDRPNGRG